MVIIVGAGPAGATAARALAASGVTVRLLDRSNFPRNKPCGGGISVRVLRRFPYLERELGRIATHAVARLYLEGPDGTSTIVESDGPAALMIRRIEFDGLLVDLARAAGAEVIGGVDIARASMDGSGVSLESRDGRRFHAPIVIAADGVHSSVARRLGLNAAWRSTAVALDMMEETPRDQLRDLDPSTLWVSYGYEPSRRTGRRAAEGYAYIFPKRDHVNVGIGYVLDHYRRTFDAAPYDLQRAFVDHLRDRGVMQGESVRAHFTPFLIPIGGPLRRPGRGRVLLAGDAAGFVNGFTAEGIYYAMVSGDLAARAIVETPRSALNSLASRYRRACEREIGAELRDSVLIRQYLFADRRRVARAIAGVRTSPALTRLVLDFAVGRLSYRALRRRMLARAPLLTMHLVWAQLQKTLLSTGDRVATM
jgi:geranylgeranyl reductase family protein